METLGLHLTISELTILPLLIFSLKMEMERTM